VERAESRSIGRLYILLCPAAYAWIGASGTAKLKEAKRAPSRKAVLRAYTPGRYINKRLSALERLYKDDKANKSHKSHLTSHRLPAPSPSQ
jgi:hypothetical protein